MKNQSHYFSATLRKERLLTDPQSEESVTSASPKDLNKFQCCTIQNSQQSKKEAIFGRLYPIKSHLSIFFHRRNNIHELAFRK